MNPKWQFVFFLAAAACFFMGAFKEDFPPGWHMNAQRYACLGFLCFAVPFVYNAGSAGW